MNVKKFNIRKTIRIIWFSLVGIFSVWMWSTFQSRNLPEDTFTSDQNITVTKTDDQITFKPVGTQSAMEVIFFQGALTDPKAYAPLCRKIAESGFTCHLIKMAFRLASKDYKKISGIFDLKSGNYVIGGHSQGGKMAAQFVYENPGIMKGLFLLGTSHPRDIDLSNLPIPALKLYGENDGLASVGEVMENKDKLPKNAKLILIKGGNHSQFGYLGKLFTDDKAGISLKEQQQITFDYLIAFLNEIKIGNNK